jgi:hypothetical protein
MQRGNFGLEIPLQISFRVGCDFALRQVETKSSQSCDDHHDGGEEPSSKACHTFVSGLNRRSHWKSTWRV